jgi:quercetin dioxygenase-like cupin family protein
MTMSRIFFAGCAAVLIGLVFEAGIAAGERSAPREPRGVSAGVAGTLELGPELDSLEGRQLRVRIITFEPGGAVPLHSHDGRPGIAHVLKGTVTEHVEGKGVFRRNQGDSLIEDKHTVHWVENRGDEVAVVFATDVYKP